MSHGPAKLDWQGVRGVHAFAARVIRDKRFKAWVNPAKKIHRLHDLIDDPWEETNLLDGDPDDQQQAALSKFQTVVDGLPAHDARPLYEPRDPNPWDNKPAGSGRKRK